MATVDVVVDVTSNFLLCILNSREKKKMSLNSIKRPRMKISRNTSSHLLLLIHHQMFQFHRFRMMFSQVFHIAINDLVKMTGHELLSKAGVDLNAMHLGKIHFPNKHRMECELISKFNGQTHDYHYIFILTYKRNFNFFFNV